MNRIFVDTDVCLDLLSGRKPFHHEAELIFSMADKGQLKIYISALSFSNIDYILRSQYSTQHSRALLAQFKTLVNVLSVGDKTIDLALSSGFNDFEDAIQYSCAIEHNLNIILTRNTKDFKKAAIQIISPKAFVALR